MTNIDCSLYLEMDSARLGSFQIPLKVTADQPSCAPHPGMLDLLILAAVLVSVTAPLVCAAVLLDTLASTVVLVTTHLATLKQ